MPDHNVLPEDMNLGIHPFIMTDAERTAKEAELQQKLTLLQEQYLQMDGLEDLRRLDQQTQSIQMRLNLLAQTVLNDQKLRQPIRTLNFTTDITFSPQLKEAILAQERTREIVQRTAQRVADELGYSQGHDLEDKKIDLRDFREMIEVSSELTPEEITAQAESYVRDYLSDDPILHKARLDEFYDRIDSIDLAALDLSCLSGVKNETGQLSNSERDFLKLVSLMRSSQTIAVKASENPGYLEARYPTPEARLRYDLTQDLLTLHGFLSYTMMDVMNNNLFDANLHPIERKCPIDSPERAIAAQICLQTYRQQLSALQGISTGSSNIKLIIPDNAAQGFYNTTHSNTPDASIDLFNEVLSPVFDNVVAQKYMQETGLTHEDLIFIDGVSLREKIEQEYPNASARERNIQTKHAVIQALFNGEHRVELASIQMNDKGTYSIEVSGLQPDMHAMDKYELQAEHSAFRRAFNFGLSKVETRADRADKLWANDPERQKRQQQIHDRINHQIIAKINDKDAQERLRLDREELAQGAPEREQEHLLMVTACNRQLRTTCHNDLAFFGWMLGDEQPEAYSDAVREALDSRVPDSLQSFIPRDISEQVGLTYTNNGFYTPIQTMFRQGSRVDMVNLYALTQGMTIAEVLSSNPALDERKAEIGHRFMEQFKVLGPDEFYEKNGHEANYAEYFENKHQEIFQVYEQLHEVLNSQSMDCFMHTDPAALAANYTRMDFIKTASQDIFQTPSKRLRAVNADRLMKLETKARCIGETRHILDYCSYIASDSYVNPDHSDYKDCTEIRKACSAKANMERFQESCRGMQTTGEISQQVDEKWGRDAGDLFVAYASTNNFDPKLFKEEVQYLRTGQNPLHFKDPKSGEYIIDYVAKIQAMQKTSQTKQAISWQEFEEIEELNQNSPIAQRTYAHDIMNAAISNHHECAQHNDQAFFGWLAEGKDAELTTLVPNALKVNLPEDIVAQLGLSKKESYSTLKTLGRQTSRNSMISLFALSEGMSMEEVLSSDPALDERKTEIGRKFIETFKVLGTEEFYEKNGKDANYTDYFKTRHEEMLQAYERLHETLGNQTLDCFMQTDPEALADNYSRILFLKTVSQDIFQTPSNYLKNVNREHLQQLEFNHRSLGEAKYFLEYCNFVSSDLYVQPDRNNFDHYGKFSSACAARANMDRFKDSCQNLNSVEDLKQVIGPEWSSDALYVLEAYVKKMPASNTKLFEEAVNYMQTGQNPLHFKDTEKNTVVINYADKIRTMQRQADNVMNWRDFEEIPELNQRHLENRANQANRQNQREAHNRQPEAHVRGPR